MRKKLLPLMVAILLVFTLSIALVGCKPMPLDNPISEVDLTESATISESSNKSAKNLIDNKSSTWKSKNHYKDGFSELQFVVFDFGKEVTMNTAIIEESGSKVRFFHLQKWDGEYWQTFYASDKIEDYRMCVFSDVTTTKVRFVVDDAISNFKIKELSLYNMAKKDMTEPFRVSAYVRFDGDNPREVLKKGDEFANVYAEYYDVVTDVILFSTLGWTPNGDIEYFGNEKLSNDENKANFEADLTAFREILDRRTNKQHNVRITATIHNPGGDGVTGASLSNNMDKIVNNIYDTVIKYNLDGIDIDWEYPTNDKEWKLYDDFINKVNDKFDTFKDKDITYSSALSAWGVKLQDSTIARIDQLNYMGYDAYDKDGWQSTFKVTAVDAMAYYKSLGFNPSQINLGIPTFARPTATGLYWPVWRDYDFGEDGYWKNYYYNISYSGMYGSAHFNSPGMAADKTAYAINTGVGGVMIFRLGCDKFMDDPNCITKAIGKTINERINYVK